MQGKVAVVTGGARGIGRATALALAERGARVVLNDLHSMDEAQEVAREVEAAGSTALVHQADVADRGQMERLFEAAVARFARVDIEWRMLRGMSANRCWS